LLGSPDVLTGGTDEVDCYEALLEDGTIHGLKFFPGHEAYYPTDARCVPFFAACEQLNLPVVFHTGANSGDPKAARYNDPEYFRDLAERYPSLNIVITHYFWPRIQEGYEITRDVPNIHFEIAAMANPGVIRASGGIGLVRDTLARTIDDRPTQVMFGSDWPMCRIQDHLDLLKALSLDPAIQQMVLGRNAANLYRLPI
jgi:predicted TIM-barrel fold metal-dependent hydrolase